MANILFPAGTKYAVCQKELTDFERRGCYYDGAAFCAVHELEHHKAECSERGYHSWNTIHMDSSTSATITCRCGEVKSFTVKAVPGSPWPSKPAVRCPMTWNQDGPLTFDIFPWEPAR